MYVQTDRINMKILMAFCILILALTGIFTVFADAPKTPKIVFSSSVNLKAKEGSDIYIMNPDGSGRIRLTRHNPSDSEPVWSPSGKHILFTSDRDGGNDLYRMNADGTNVRRVFKKWADRSNPAWSPDGRQIAYFHGDDHAIYIASIDGRNEERLVTGSHPTWSPNGKEIAFVSLDRSFDIRVVDLKTRLERVVVPMEMEKVSLLREPVWSPDGTKIAFVRVNILMFILKVVFGGKEPMPAQTIDIVNSDGTGVEVVVLDGLQASDPAWSPWSDALIYSQVDGKERHLFKVALGSAISEQITQAGFNYSSDWFDPRFLPVEPRPQLRMATWGKIKAN